jgi:predicted RNA binding protein YcfA (HicA-like mRNA interferase family)
MSRDRVWRDRAVQALKKAGFEIARTGDRKHEKMKHPDGRTAIIGFNTCDRNLLNRVLKQVNVGVKL